VGVALSIGSADDELAARTEPGAAPPSQRLEAVAKLADAGLRPSVLIAPVLPGLSDSDESLRAVARACAEAGARNVVPIVLHLRPGVREHYLQWLAGEHPELLDEHLHRYDGRAYLPRSDGQRVALVVREAFDRARTRSGARRSRKRLSCVTTSSVPA
jgi:DNA repair photolyase